MVAVEVDSILAEVGLLEVDSLLRQKQQVGEQTEDLFLVGMEHEADKSEAGRKMA